MGMLFVSGVFNYILSRPLYGQLLVYECSLREL